MTRPGEDEEEALRHRLRQLRVAPPDGGFGAALHRRLAAAPPPEPPGLWSRLREGGVPGPRLAWPAAGLAAGVAAFLALGLLREPRRSERQPAELAATELPATRVAVIRLNLTAEVAVESAAIQVRLPDGLVFWSQGRSLPERIFEWSQPLAMGSNEIPIAVRGARPGRYLVTVRTRVGDQQIDEEISLEVVDG